MNCSYYYLTNFDWKDAVILYLLSSVIFCIHILIKKGYYKDMIWHPKKVENYRKKHGYPEL